MLIESHTGRSVISREIFWIGPKKEYPITQYIVFCEDLLRLLLVCRFVGYHVLSEVGGRNKRIVLHLMKKIYFSI